MRNDDLDTANAPEPGKPWKFDESVADSFPDMLSKSIPGYQDMRDVILRLAQKSKLQPYNTILDIGASTGESILPLMHSNLADEYHAIEISEPMRKHLRKNVAFRGGGVRFMSASIDLRTRELAKLVRSNFGNINNEEGYRLITSILTLIFVPINFRPNILKAVYDLLAPGAMFLMTEKLQGSDYLIDNLMVDTYHQYKHDNGYSWEAIERKRLSLENVQVPLTESANVDLLKQAGFRHIEVAHKFLNFATFVAIKD